MDRQYRRREHVFYREIEITFALSSQAKARNVVESGEGYQLRQRPTHYKALFGAEKDDIGLENTYFWDVKTE